MTSESSQSTVEPIKMSALKKCNKNNNSTTKTRNGTKKQKHTCAKCNRNYSSAAMLNDHIRSNCSRRPQYECEICSRKYFSKSTLTCHLTIHTGELPHKCNFCDKRFRTRGQVTVHHRIHTGEKPFSCQVLNSKINITINMHAHISLIGVCPKFYTS